MKKILLTLITAVTIQFSYAQFSSSSGNTTTTDKVGIGSTAPPQSTLEVSGTGYSATKLITLSESESTRYSGNIGITVSGGTQLNFGTRNDNINYNNTLNLFNGNVGIGTTNPTAKLQIETTGNSDPNGSLVNSNIDAIIIGANGYGQSAISSRQYDAINQPAAGDTQFLNLFYNGSTYNWYERMRISANGNVGIGTTTPDTKLAVNGTIHTKEVKVDLTGWPDYVFKPKYKLPSLTDVKNYINKNQHLPEMPSETEVAKNGINLGEMVKLQTKKIEELTLYLIEKDKQLTKQQKVTESQQEQINKLKQQLSVITKALTKN